MEPYSANAHAQQQGHPPSPSQKNGEARFGLRGPTWPHTTDGDATSTRTPLDVVTQLNTDSAPRTTLKYSMYTTLMQMPVYMSRTCDSLTKQQHISRKSALALSRTIVAWTPTRKCTLKQRHTSEKTASHLVLVCTADAANSDDTGELVKKSMTAG